MMPSDSFSRAYRYYMLFVLMLVYVFNFIDRQILSILAEDIKHDLGISDASLGFLLGTSFAVFYAVFGVLLGRAADLINRTKLIAAGLFTWSLMTSLSGLVRGFVPLAFCRMGVGIGEASASPAVFSLLYDIFPKKRRGVAIAIYSGGLYIGAGLGLIIGGFILVKWREMFPSAALAPLGLQAWQAAFLIVGLPGILLAALVLTLREPQRGSSDGVTIAPHPHPFRAIGLDLVALFPGVGLMIIARRGGASAAFANIAIAAGLALFAAFLIYTLGGVLQWTALGYGAYVFATWIQKLALTEPESYRAIFHCKPLILGSIGFSGCFFLMAGGQAWLPMFLQRAFGASASEVGLILGLSYAVMGFLGVIVGGILSDWSVSRFGGKGRMYAGTVAVICASLTMAALVVSSNVTVAFLLTFPYNFFAAMYVAPGAANANSLVPPPIRATSSAVYIVATVFLGSALGPYVIGAISDALVANGVGSAEALRYALLLSLLVAVPAAVLMLVASRIRFDDYHSTGATSDR